MPNLRVPFALISTSRIAVAGLLLSVCPVAAQDSPLSEDVAIERALARAGIAARDDALLVAAQAEVDVIGPLDNPSAEISYESVGDEREWHLGVVQPIDLGGSRGALRNAARAEAEAVAADIERRKQELAGEVRSAYVRCAAAGASLEVLQRYLTVLTEAERVSTARAEAGDTAVYDVRRVRVEQRAAQASVLRAMGDASADCSFLAALTGIESPKVELAAVTRLGSQESIAARPDVTAQEQRVLAASQRVAAARKARLPQLAVGVGLKRVEDESSTAYGPAVSLGVSLPIWNGGGAAVRRAEAQKTAVESELVITRRRIEAEQSSAAIRATAARDAAVASASAHDDAGRLGAIAETAYQSGEIGVVELLDAYEAARDADLSVIALALDAALAAVEYDLATGRTF